MKVEMDKCNYCGATGPEGRLTQYIDILKSGHVYRIKAEDNLGPDDYDCYCPTCFQSLLREALRIHQIKQEGAAL